MSKHPIVPYTVSHWVHVINGLSVLCIISSILFIINVYPTLPDTIPIHFNSQGEADDWGHKAFVFLTPIFTIALFVPLYIVSKKPHIFNYPIEITKNNASRIYPVARLFMTILNFECALIFSYLSIDIFGQYLNATFLISLFMIVILTLVLFLFTIIRLRHD